MLIILRQKTRMLCCKRSWRNSKQVGVELGTRIALMRNGRSIEFQKSKIQKSKSSKESQMLVRTSKCEKSTSTTKLGYSLSDHPKPDRRDRSSKCVFLSFWCSDKQSSSDIAIATLYKFKMLYFDAETHSRIDIYTIDSANGRSIILPSIILFQVLCISV